MEIASETDGDLVQSHGAGSLDSATRPNLTRVSVALEEIGRAVSLVAPQVSDAMTMMVVS
jgi:hypothetical protein